MVSALKIVCRSNFCYLVRYRYKYATIENCRLHRYSCDLSSDRFYSSYFINTVHVFHLLRKATISTSIDCFNRCSSDDVTYDFFLDPNYGPCFTISPPRQLEQRLESFAGLFYLQNVLDLPLTDFRVDPDLHFGSGLKVLSCMRVHR